MCIRTKLSLAGIAMLLAACAAKVTRPIEAVSIYHDLPVSASLAHIDDLRPAESRASSGDGVDIIVYGDDKLSPLPVQVLDRTLSERLQAVLQEHKVAIVRYTVSMFPVVPEYNPVNDIYGPSLVTSILGSGSTTPTSDHRYECHIKGSVAGRAWWVKHSIPSTDKGRTADLEELIRQCNQEALTRIRRIAG